MTDKAPEWPISLDRNGYGQIIINQNRSESAMASIGAIFGNRVILTPAQVEELCRFYRTEKSG